MSDQTDTWADACRLRIGIAFLIGIYHSVCASSPCSRYPPRIGNSL